MLVAVGGAGGGGGGSQGISGGKTDFDFQNPPRLDFSAPFRGLDLPFFTTGLVLVLVSLAVVVVVSLWVLGTLSRGGLIYGADQVSRGMSSSFTESFRLPGKTAGG